MLIFQSFLHSPRFAAACASCGGGSDSSPTAGADSAVRPPPPAPARCNESRRAHRRRPARHYAFNHLNTVRTGRRSGLAAAFRPRSDTSASNQRLSVDQRFLHADSPHYENGQHQRLHPAPPRSADPQRRLPVHLCDRCDRRHSARSRRPALASATCSTPSITVSMLSNVLDRRHRYGTGTAAAFARSPGLAAGRRAGGLARSRRRDSIVASRTRQHGVARHLPRPPPRASACLAPCCLNANAGTRSSSVRATRITSRGTATINLLSRCPTLRRQPSCRAVILAEPTITQRRPRRCRAPRGLRRFVPSSPLAPHLRLTLHPHQRRPRAGVDQLVVHRRGARRGNLGCCPI